MNLYLTFADQPSGVYHSQVEDVVNYLNSIEGIDIKLIAFVSFRDFISNRRKIKANVPNAMVLPMWPKLQNWRLNRFLLYAIFSLTKPNTVVARNVLAGCLALKCRDKRLIKSVVYDGRGAISAEWKEYHVVDNERLKRNIEEWEKTVVLKSDKQVAVSNELVTYWKKHFEFSGQHSVVIPCTLDKKYEKLVFNVERQKELKRQLGFHQEDIVLAYSGSVAGWQSSGLLAGFLVKQLNLQSNVSVLFLSDETDQITKLKKDYPKRIASTFISPEEVPDYLMVGDYGLLIREDTLTNKVASPVKFAEYLACGLKVLISSNIGDYSQIVKENELGILCDRPQAILEPVSRIEKQRNRDFALTHFTKSQYRDSYLSIFKS